MLPEDLLPMVSAGLDSSPRQESLIRQPELYVRYGFQRFPLRLTSIGARHPERWSAVGQGRVARPAAGRVASVYISSVEPQTITVPPTI